MKLHEYQGKALLRSEDVNVPENRIAYFPEEAWMISMDMGYPVILKAQVLAGGRGKSGGMPDFWIIKQKHPTFLTSLASYFKY